MAQEGLFSIKGIEIEGLRTFHDESDGRKRGINTIYRFRIDDMTFCHMGDLGHTLDDRILKQIGKVDVLFIPVGGVTTINADQAKVLIEKIGPRIAVPMHYRITGLGLVLDGLDNFLRGIPEEKIYRVGNEIDFTHDDIADDMEYWVFSM
ncbi:MAG: hypothetical protein PWQ88_682 [Candidatus Methanomethylophilaceae archaeon]|nr:hypothetical protein [Candidatus Methanomethylophilaceae archaeon]